MIATIINFSTNEASFLKHCIEEALCFSEQIIIPVCDHLFDGTPENRELLSAIYAAHPKVQFVEYAWSKKNFYGEHSTHFWHNLSRLIGTHFLSSSIEYVLFLDVDEIVEGKQFATWLSQTSLDFTALSLACYWYFREPHFQALQWEESPLLISKKAIAYDRLMQPHERGGTLHQTPGKKVHGVTSEENLPMVHHYSWVRSKEALLRKVSTWGHRDERDWKALIEEEFSKEFSGTDFVHGYRFTKVNPYLRSHCYSISEKSSENVITLTTTDVHKIDLSIKFDLAL